jgi:hypothetical protein
LEGLAAVAQAPDPLARVVEALLTVAGLAQFLRERAQRDKQIRAAAAVAQALRAVGLMVAMVVLVLS